MILTHIVVSNLQDWRSKISNWVDYWRIVTPQTPKKEYTTLAQDSISSAANSPFPSMMNYAWYTQVIKGATSRMQRYMQYDSMDSDTDVSRALDTIAEEMAVQDDRTGLPFMIDYQNEEDQSVSETVVTTLRAAVRHWANLQDFDNRIFRVARHLIKYGDCFFKKTSDLKRWEFLDPKTVIGIEINENGEKIAYHLRKQSLNNAATGKAEFNVIPAKGIIHFTLSDEMGDSMPFGDSILQPVYRVFRQMMMLEDSIIIYRIVRAPERRAFYIDVGNMPAQRVKAYLEQVKNDIRQKRIPGQLGDFTDSTYNPMSSSEDYFFPVTGTGRGSRVETLPGGENLGENTDLLYFQKKVFRGLRVPTSYMSGQDAQGAQFNDGKVGIAYIEELRFANFVKRLQTKIEQTFDDQFKVYLTSTGIKVDPDLFELKLPDPQNFALYRQAALDGDLINTFNSADGIKYLSKKFILKRYLGLTEDEIQMNEALVKQERGIIDTGTVSDDQQIYDPAVYENREPIKIEAPADEAPAGEVPSEEPSDDTGLDLPDEGNDAEAETAAPEVPDEAPAEEA